MFNLKCRVKGMLFYLAMSESQGCVGSLCPPSLASRLRSDLYLSQGSLKLCLPDYWWFFSMFEFLASWFCELTSKLQGLGEKCGLFPCPLLFVYLEGICSHLQLPIPFLGKIKVLFQSF